MIIQESMRLKVLILPVSLVVAVIAVIFFIKPSFSDIMSAKDSLAAKQKQLESLKNQTQKLQVMKSKWDAMADEKNLVETAFPETENADSYISEITSKASRSGILLTNITLGQKNSGGTGGNPDYICTDDSNAASSQPAAAAQPPAAGAPPPAGASGSCLKPVSISLSAAGSWEQMLDFFKYLEDMNRISNIDALSLSTSTQNQVQGQASADILSVDISATAFFKEKSQSGITSLASNLAVQGSFNQQSLDKLKETIYAPYDVPAVSPSGQRNIFK